MAVRSTPIRVVNLTSEDISFHTYQGQEHVPAEAGSGSPAVFDYGRPSRNPPTLTDGNTPVAYDIAPGRLVDSIPAPAAQTVYVTSRDVAMTVRRPDVAFIYHPDAHSPVGYLAFVDGLGPLRRARYRFAQWRRTVAPRIWRNPSDTWIAITLTVSTACLGALLVLGIDTWRDAADRDWWILGIVAAVTVVVLAFAWTLWRNASRARRGRGTAYLIDETGLNWTTAERSQFNAVVADQFSTVLEVPGPVVGPSRWQWTLEDRVDAKAWTGHLSSLVSNFEVVRHNDDHLTDSAVFLSAYWPVAFALGLELPKTRRGQVLNVCQRPSDGNGPRVTGYERTAFGPNRPKLDAAHDFLSAQDRDKSRARCRLAVQSRDFKVALTVDGLTHRDSAKAVRPEIRIVAIRLVAEQFGSAEADADLVDTQDFTMKVTNWSDTPLPPGNYAATELRLTRSGRPLASRTEIPWSDYPAIVDQIVDWFATQDFSNTVVFLATTVPQEIGFGLGMVAHKRPDVLPASLLPMNYVPWKGAFVVPDFDLGRIARER